MEKRKKKIDRIGWRETEKDEYFGDEEDISLHIIRKLLGGEELEWIGGIDVEDKEGNLIDTGKELEDFFNIKEKAYDHGETSYARIRFDNEEYLLYNDRFPFSGGNTLIFRIKK